MREADVPAEQSETREEARLSSSHVDARGPGHPASAAPQGTPSPVGLIWRVRDRATFTALQRARRRARAGPITIAWVPGDPTTPPRVAYAIGRRVGGAVVRNRLRRRLRAVISDVRPQLAAGAYLVGAGPEAAGLTFAELRSHVSDALASLAR